MHIERVGHGPDLGLLHGWAMHGGIFAPLVDELSAHFRLHLVDLPGHGRSADSGLALEPEAIAAALQAECPRAPWLGWSLGGQVALHLAATRPEAVRGLVLVCATPRFVRSDDWPQGMPESVFQGFADELGRDYRATIDRFLALEAQGEERMREVLRRLRAEVYGHGEPSPAVLAQGLRWLMETDQRALLPRLRAPSLWIAGRRDRLVSPLAMRAAADRCADARYLEISSGGHAPFLTHAAQIARAVRDFAEALPA
jgi:pimeloyl-[acyl-carrier protein] methyl ester esterase